LAHDAHMIAAERAGAYHGRADILHAFCASKGA
jgi:hypothetical protein